MNKINLGLFNCFLILLGVSLVPICYTAIPPLVDYPNHLARIHIIQTIEKDEGLQNYYNVNWEVLPNLAMDIFAPLFLKKTNPYAAGKIFIFVIFFLLVSGTFALYYVLHRELSHWPLLSLLFLYNRPFLWGFLNFLFGIGICLWVFALWIALCSQSPRLRVILFSTLSTILFFCHLYALCIYGLCAIGYTLYRHIIEKSEGMLREWTFALSQFLFPALLFFGFSPIATTGAIQDIQFGDFDRKFGAIFQPINNYSHFLDGATFVVLVGLFLYGLWRKKIYLSNQILFPLLLLGIIFFTMPERLLTVYGADTRIPTPFVLLLIAGSRPSNFGRALKIFLVCFLLALFFIRLIILSSHWLRADKLYSDFRNAISHMENNRLLFTAIGDQDPWQPFPIPLQHLSCIAVIERSAFVPTLFANEAQQPVSFEPVYQSLVEKFPGPRFTHGGSPDWSEIAKDYDYLLIFRENFFSERPSSRWRTVYKGNDLRLLKAEAMGNGIL